MNSKIPYLGVTPVQVITAAIILVVGFILTKIITALFKKSLKKTVLPEILIDFLSKLLYLLLIVSVLLLVVGSLGFSIGSLMVSLSAILGLILGFGLQDTLTNMGAGFWIAMTRPFNKGDVVSVAGITGQVKVVNVMATEFITVDNTFITIPNKTIWGAPITNYTRMDTRRVDVTVGVAYGTDLNNAVSIAMDIMKKHNLILDNPEPAVVVTELADSSVNLQLRAWVKTGDYWTVKGDITKTIYEVYSEKGIEIPFPQMDVHILKEG